MGLCKEDFVGKELKSHTAQSVNVNFSEWEKMTRAVGENNSLKKAAEKEISHLSLRGRIHLFKNFTKLLCVAQSRYVYPNIVWAQYENQRRNGWMGGRMDKAWNRFKIVPYPFCSFLSP